MPNVTISVEEPDGWGVYMDRNEHDYSFASLRDFNTADETWAGSLWHGQIYDDNDGDDYYRLHRAYMWFDTSSIPDGATINSAEISAEGINGQDGNYGTCYTGFFLGSSSSYPTMSENKDNYDIDRVGTRVSDYTAFYRHERKTVTLYSDTYSEISEGDYLKLYIISKRDMQDNYVDYETVAQWFDTGSGDNIHLNVDYNPPVTIDGENVQDITIDGNSVQGLTIDGQAIW